MKAMLIKTVKGLHGATDEDHAKWLKFKRRLETIKPGKWLRMEWSTPRNGPQHRKMFALFSLVKENSETYNTTEKALVAVKLCVGHFDLVIDPTTGEITKQVKSIAFESMEQDDFDVFYGQAIDGVLQYILPQMDRETADRLLEMIVEGWA
jgi:hypothetical protein